MRFATLAFVCMGMFCASTLSLAQAAKPIGQITAAFGKASVENAGRSRGADLHSTISNDERVVTHDAGLSLLLQTRIVVKLDALTSVRFSEGTGQTTMLLENGTMQIFAGKRPAYMGASSVQDALARVEGKDAVFLASYDRATRTGYYACEHGTVHIELAADKKRIVLNADQQAIAREGKPLQITALDRQAYDSHNKTLQRLGESVLAQGSQTQRQRSGELDTRIAVSQLEAAGWIDRKTLVVILPPSQSTANDQAARSNTASEVSSNAPTNAPTGTSPPELPQVENNADFFPEIERPAEQSNRDDDDDSRSISKPEKSRDLPKIKPPKVDKFERDDDDHGVRLPKLPKVEKVRRDNEIPDLKLPKFENSKPGKDFDLKDLKEVTKRTREQVEKRDKRGRGGDDDDD